MKIYKNCEYCNIEFEADTKEIKRGFARFCSRSCSCKNSNKIRPLIKQKCQNCNINFESKNKSKYCCKNCKLIVYRNKQKSNTGSIKKFYKILQNIPCELCGWKESIRDLHHIIPVSENGKNELENLIVLCPNHHRMVHKNLISEDSLKKAILLRTISSP